MLRRWIKTRLIVKSLILRDGREKCCSKSCKILIWVLNSQIFNGRDYDKFQDTRLEELMIEYINCVTTIGGKIITVHVPILDRTDKAQYICK